MVKIGQGNQGSFGENYLWYADGQGCSTTGMSYFCC